jgi:hypothetical protein
MSGSTGRNLDGGIECPGIKLRHADANSLRHITPLLDPKVIILPSN